MSILIKGMKMPTEGRFMAIYKIKGKFYVSQNDELCPIIELSDHGDLIDRDEYIRTVCCNSFPNFSEAVRISQNMPVIIPAEGSESD